MNVHQKTIAICALLAPLAALSLGCVQGADGPTPDAEETSIMQVTARVQAIDDVRGFSYEATRVGCDDAGAPAGHYDQVLTEKALYLADGAPAFPGGALDASATQMFADGELAVPAGCYDITARPLGPDGAPSTTCYASTRKLVSVDPATAQEIVLVSECFGPARPADGVTDENNDPPEIVEVTYDNSSELLACESVRVCVRAVDPDKDAISFEWSSVKQGDVVLGPRVLSTTRDEEGGVTQCVAIHPGYVGDFDFDVTAYDMVTLDTGELTRVEELLQEQSTGALSHDTDTVSLHVPNFCDTVGRAAVIMLTMSNEPGMGEKMARQLAANAVGWVNPDTTQDPTVLVVRDDRHKNEYAEDTAFVVEQLRAAGFEHVDMLKEPADGLLKADVEGYDVIWFSNPGYPIDDLNTRNTLLKARGHGQGVVLQGDDMSWFFGANALMESLSHLEHINNGTRTCGVKTDNNQGENYRVTFEANTYHPLIEKLQGQEFLYGNDIDHTTPLYQGEVILATARLDDADCDVVTNALVAIDPDLVFEPEP